MTPAAADSSGPRRIVGRYRLEHELGRGAMGTVWAAYDEVLHRSVAVKEVRLSSVPVNERAIVRERTLREARSTAMLSHPNVVTLYDVVEVNSEPYVVMELLPSRSLASYIGDRGQLTQPEAAEIGSAVASALATAHRAGITHRDVKPGNVLIGENGQIKLTDFGIARNAAEQSMTQTGTVLGSPPYIAPEVAMGRAVGPAADLWGLGATLFACLEGRPPYDAGDPVGTVTEVVHGEVPVPHGRGPVVDVIRGLMVKDPALRMPLEAVRRRLRPLLSDPEGPVLAVSTGPRTAAIRIPPPGEDSDQAGLLPVSSSRGPAGTLVDGSPAATPEEPPATAASPRPRPRPSPQRPDDPDDPDAPSAETPVAGSGESDDSAEKDEPAAEAAEDAADADEAADEGSEPAAAGAAVAAGVAVGAAAAAATGGDEDGAADEKDEAPAAEAAEEAPETPAAEVTTPAAPPEEDAAPAAPTPVEAAEESAEEDPEATPADPADEPTEKAAGKSADEPAAATDEDAESPAEVPAAEETTPATSGDAAADETPEKVPDAAPDTPSDEPTETPAPAAATAPPEKPAPEPTKTPAADGAPRSGSPRPAAARVPAPTDAETTMVGPRVPPGEEVTRTVRRPPAPPRRTPGPPAAARWTPPRGAPAPGSPGWRPGPPRPPTTGTGTGTGTGQPLAVDPGPLPFTPSARPAGPPRRSRWVLAAVVALLVLVAALGAIGAYALTRALAGQPATSASLTAAGPEVAGTVLIAHADTDERYAGTGLGFSALVPADWQQFRLEQPGGDVAVRFVSPDAQRELRIDRVTGFFPSQRTADYVALLARPASLGVDASAVGPVEAVGPAAPGAEPPQQTVYRTTSGPTDDRTTWTRLVPSGTALWVVRLTAVSTDVTGAPEQFRAVADSFAGPPA
ncbi:protein kinase domain-containing protein [Actinomycetospora sp. CA-101289]|uniref:serine/threonine-protein kinase n=1 Tax=Actinomycetospora sp. CA-101289 TaxID=3239893 RepID=UPI003D970FE9